MGEEERKLFSSAINSLKREKPFTCKTENILDYVHKDDVANMFVRLIENERLYGDYNIGSGKGYKVKDLIRVIAKRLGKEHLVSFQTCEIKQTIISDNSKILSVPYELQYSIEEGLAQMIEGNESNEVPAL